MREEQLQGELIQHTFIVHTLLVLQINCYYYHHSVILFCGQLVILMHLVPMYICQIPLQMFGTITTFVKTDSHTILFMIHYLSS